MSTHQLVHLGINHCAIWICEAECARRLHHSNREGCIISNGVQFRPHAHFPSLFTPVCFCFFCLFFPAIAPASTTLVSSPHHTTPQLTALTASDSQNMRPVAFTENLRLFEKNSLLWHINTLPSPSLSFFPLCPSLVLLGFFCFFCCFFSRWCAVPTCSRDCSTPPCWLHSFHLTTGGVEEQTVVFTSRRPTARRDALGSRDWVVREKREALRRSGLWWPIQCVKTSDL